jgi:PTH1 family peptidyl-tRNA hydrolase
MDKMYDIFEKLKTLNTKPSVTGTPEFLVVGLGNPEPKYDTTRHNAGFMAIDRIAQKTGCKVDQLKFKSLYGMCEIEGKKVMLMKPSTYMNNSGEAVQEASQFYKIGPEHIIVIFDDISLDVGKMRIRRKGSDGGHNGIKSIIYLTGSDQYPRIKIGVGKKPHPDYDLAAWVLGHFSDEDMKNLSPVLDNSFEAVKEIVKGNIDRAMNLFN